MPRLVLILMAVALLLVSAAPSAHAQRDPFEPAIETGEVIPGQEPAPQATTEPNAVAPAQQMATTGVEGRPWLALSYVLLALGLGLLAFVRLSATRPGR